ncbi:hypothetical protein ACG2F4_14415 [Halalkalibaculum sp. DA3122]|uniref:hypothetical protein n=1 Tax=Halalkalibaculum sp. DA3122 TaxID=3373607 RepID=UPI0037544027
MKSLRKRLQKIEQRNRQKERPAPFVAIIKEDGTVTVSHTNEDDFTLPNEEALRSWIVDNNLNESDYLRVIIVNSQGKAPDVK